MKNEYDFSKGIRGKFYIPAEEIHLPVYLDKKNSDYFFKLAKAKKVRLSKMVNDVLAKDREIISTAVLQGK
ncbi:MAG: hypothetical protein Q8O74_06955 [bacterium]|nr:hypothetical protein [bacterium]